MANLKMVGFIPEKSKYVVAALNPKTPGGVGVGVESRLLLRKGGMEEVIEKFP